VSPTGTLALTATAVGEDLWELTLEYDEPFLLGGQFGIEQVVEFSPNPAVCDFEGPLICAPVDGAELSEDLAGISYMIVAVVADSMPPNLGDPLLLGTVRTQGIVDGQILTSLGLDVLTGVPGMLPFDGFATTFATASGDVVQMEGTVDPVPEPHAIALFLVGGGVVGWVLRRARRS
jgi:hypothetical protein